MVAYVSNHFQLRRNAYRSNCLVRKCAQHRPAWRRSAPRAVARADVLEQGIEAALEDHLVTGMNVCIGDGAKEVLVPLLSAIDSMVNVERVIDVAFLGTCETTRSLIEERQLPNDLSVNFKRELDLFIAPVVQVDKECNATLDSSELSGARYAAHIAKKVVLLTHEDDLQKSRNGLQSIPVQLAGFLPDVAAKSLISDSLFAIGVRGVTLRKGPGNIADVSIAAGSEPVMVAEELKRLPQVQAVGLLPACDKTTIVVSTMDMQPFDITPIAYSLAKNMENNTPLALNKVKEELEQLDGGWVLSENGNCGLRREFPCASNETAEALMRRVQFLKRNGGRFAELRQVHNTVTIGLGEYGSKAVCSVDLLMAKAVSNTYVNMKRVN
ncbi:unnamed protein product [Agarophyton chilense]|eukprot:gb/GEZJ01005329.1/.p1 GENE.gb/GEZJ01005329.1/~~gb/GEZJ01005329.1/.p1  ORF type:complete len:383 (+),score=52.64 gb/GEZJ01005329.1/:658-1806(+)